MTYHQVVSWFRLTRDAIHQDQGRTVPSLAFVHIPPHATRALQDAGRNPATAPGLNEELISHQGDVCDGGNNCNYSRADEPFMKALVETEDLLAVFFGHDHGIEYVSCCIRRKHKTKTSSWCMKWAKDLPNNSPTNGHGLNLCFNRHTGYGGYSDWARGGRQIILEEARLGEKTLET